MRGPVVLLVLPLLAACQREPVETPVVPAETDDAVETPVEGARALSAREYRTTIAALFGVGLADDLTLPLDARVDGFDNQQSGFHPSSVWVEGYEAAAAEVARRALALPQARERLAVTDVPVVVEPFQSNPLNWQGQIAVPSAGVYRLVVTAQYQNGEPPLRRQLLVDGHHAAWVELATGTVDQETVEVPLTAGVRTFELWTPRTDPGAVLGDAISVAVTIEGPVDPDPTSNPARDRLLDCDLQADALPCVRSTLERWLPEAWRRPVEPAEVDGLVAVAESTLSAGGTPDDALQDVLHAALAGPSFLLHAQPGPWAIANRLSYLVWAAPPDAALRARAAAGELSDPAVLQGELERLLADPRAEALVDGFGWQWLELARLDDITPSLMLYPDFDATLRDSMKEQARRLLVRILLGAEPMRALVDTPVAWLDERLAAHEGVWTTGEVDRSEVHRMGIQGLSGVEAMLSHPDRSSPSRRGAWLLDRLLCDGPGSPPEGLPSLPEDTGEPRTIDELLAQHATDPGCASCHKRMDPLGLALESFDAIGHWTGGVGIPASLEDGTTINGPEGLASWLGGSTQLDRCAARRAFTWAIGRPPADEELEAVVLGWQQREASFAGLLGVVVGARAFGASVEAP